MPKPGFIPQQLRPWIEARKRHRLSHAHIQMARELGMNPKKFGKIDNHRQEPWKAPLPIFIENLYFKRFGKRRPDEIKSIKQIAAAEMAKRRSSRLARDERRRSADAAVANVLDFGEAFIEVEGDRDIAF